MFYIGIDSGTQSTKSVVLDFETGEIVAQASQPYDLIRGLPAGHLEQRPSDWIDAVKNTVASCLDQLGDRRAEVSNPDARRAGGDPAAPAGLDVELREQLVDRRGVGHHVEVDRGHAAVE